MFYRDTVSLHCSTNDHKDCTRGIECVCKCHDAELASSDNTFEGCYP